jgi:hypothetical protein
MFVKVELVTLYGLIQFTRLPQQQTFSAYPAPISGPPTATIIRIIAQQTGLGSQLEDPTADRPRKPARGSYSRQA